MGKDESKKFYEDNNLNKTFRVSALNGYGVENAMNFLINEIVESYEIKRNSINLNSRSSVSIFNARFMNNSKIIIEYIKRKVNFKE